MKAKRRILGWLQTSGGLLCAIFLWEAAVGFFAVPEYVLPAPSKILVDLSHNLPVVLPAALTTLEPMVLGFLLAVVLGVGLSLAIVYSRFVEAAFYPLLVVLQIVPKIAVAPLFIIWVGYGLSSKVLLVFLLSFFPVVVNSIVAFKSIEPDLYDLARTYRAGRLRVFFRIELPSALPSLFAGFKVAAALSATAAVVAEFVASDSGLGYLLLHYNGNFNTSMTFATICVLSLLGLMLYGLVALVERFAIPWHVSQRRDDLQVARSGA